MMEWEELTPTCIKEFEIITLEKLEQIPLLNRFDTKYLLSIELLEEVLTELKTEYYALEVGEKRCFLYKNLYYDTPDFVFHKMHINGKEKRLKIRSREYQDCGLCYFELKKRFNRGNTEKVRIPKASLNEKLSTAECRFLQCNSVNPFNLSPSVITKYNRITLVNKDLREKVTFDFNLEFLSEFKCERIENLVVAEVKQMTLKQNSFFIELLKAKRIVRCSVSKYCLGVVATIPNAKYNRYKKKLLLINRVCK